VVTVMTQSVSAAVTVTRLVQGGRCAIQRLPVA